MTVDPHLVVVESLYAFSGIEAGTKKCIVTIVLFVVVISIDLIIVVVDP